MKYSINKYTLNKFTRNIKAKRWSFSTKAFSNSSNGKLPEEQNKNVNYSFNKTFYVVFFKIRPKT